MDVCHMHVVGLRLIVRAHQCVKCGYEFFAGEVGLHTPIPSLTLSHCQALPSTAKHCQAPSHGHRSHETIPLISLCCLFVCALAPDYGVLSSKLHRVCLAMCVRVRACVSCVSLSPFSPLVVCPSLEPLLSPLTPSHIPILNPPPPPKKQTAA